MRSVLEDYSGKLEKQVLDIQKNGIVIENDLQFENAEKVLKQVYDELKKGEEVLIVEGEIVAPDGGWDRVLFRERDKIFEEIVGKYVKTNHRKIQKSIRNVNKKPYEQILKELGFKKVRKDFYEKEIKRNEQELIQWIYDHTIFEKEKFGGREKEFEKELKTAWHKINPSGVYKEKAIWRVWHATK